MADLTVPDTGTFTEKLYSPLFVQMISDDEEHYEGDYQSDPLDQKEAAYYKDSIHEAIIDERLADEDSRGLMAYYHEDDAVNEKVRSLHVDVETHGGKLWGVAALELTDELSDAELSDLKDYLTGQYSDGFGEGFEQREIKVDGGELYVSLWDGSERFFIDTEQDFAKRLGYLPPERDNALAQQLYARVELEYASFKERLLAKSKYEIFDNAHRIASMENVRLYLTEYVHELSPDVIRGLLWLKAPLKAIAYAWKERRNDVSSMEGLIYKVACLSDIDDRKDSGKANRPSELASEKPSVLEQIHQAQKDVRSGSAPHKNTPTKNHEFGL
jgi:hypothetical protein